MVQLRGAQCPPPSGAYGRTVQSRIATLPANERVIRRQIADECDSRADSQVPYRFAAATFSSARKAITTLPANITIQGLGSFGAHCEGDYSYKATVDRAGRAVSCPSVVYEKDDGSGPQLVFERGLWALLSSPTSEGSIAFCEAAEVTPCTVDAQGRKVAGGIPKAAWKISDGSPDWLHPSTHFEIIERGNDCVVETPRLKVGSSTRWPQTMNHSTMLLDRTQVSMDRSERVIYDTSSSVPLSTRRTLF